MVLFETPSGFAVLRYHGTSLLRSEALKDMWMNFTNKRLGELSVAINRESGLSEQLVQMIRKWHFTGQKLAVGNGDYKEIIQEKMGIHCLFDEAVMELMWGLKNLMKTLVPGETCELTREEGCHMSIRMQLILNKYGFKVEPEMVDDALIVIASVLYESDYCVNTKAEYLHRYGDWIKEISDINFCSWDLQKLSAAHKLICSPCEEIETGNSDEMLSEDIAHRLVVDAPKYERYLNKPSCLGIYRQIKFTRSMRSEALALLKSSQSQAQGTCPAQQMVEEKL